MKRVLTYLYSGLSLFVGIWGIVSGLISLNGQQTTNNYFVYISLVVLTIFAPVAVYAISKRNRKDTLSSIKERFIEDEEMLPSTLSYLIDTIVSPSITNKGVSVEKIEVDITIDKSNDGHIANSTIIRTFSGIKAKHKISELELLINHHIFADFNDYLVTASYGLKNDDGEYSYMQEFSPRVFERSKSTMLIQIPFRYRIDRKQDFSVRLKVICKKSDINLEDSVETFPIDPSTMFSKWNCVLYRFHIQDHDLISTRTLQMVAYSRPKLTKVLSKPVLYVDKIPENESVEIQVDRARFFPKRKYGFPEKSLIIAVLQRRK